MFCTIMADEETEYLAWAFCRTIYEDCGRYKRAVAGQDVPGGLLPTGDLVIDGRRIHRGVCGPAIAITPVKVKATS